MRSRLALAASFLALLGGVAAGCGGSGSAGLPPGAVAVVAGQAISRQELDATVDQALSRLRAQGQKPPGAGSDQYRSLQQSALQYLVQRTELALEAKRLGVTVSDKEVDDRLQKLKKQFFSGSDKRYRQALKAQGVSEQSVRSELRAQLLSEKLFDKVTADVAVSDADIESYYRSHLQDYSQPETREVRHILVKTRKQAEEIVAKLKAGADFAALAKRYSTDPGSRSVGGKLTVQKGQFVPEFEKVALALRTKAISQPVKTQYGWHVIQALGPVKPGTTTPLAKVRASIRQLLLQQRKSEAAAAWLDDLRRRYEKKITYAPGFAPPPPQATTTPTPPGQSR
ncbi:MAG: hypothetical protein C4306_04880 [Thermoleophilia bacterium]